MVMMIRPRSLDPKMRMLRRFSEICQCQWWWQPFTATWTCRAVCSISQLSSCCCCCCCCLASSTFCCCLSCCCPRVSVALRANIIFTISRNLARQTSAPSSPFPFFLPLSLLFNLRIAFTADFDSQWSLLLFGAFTWLITSQKRFVNSA